MSIMQRVMSVYQGSDAVATRALYADLEALGAAGVLAAHLLRASKKSARAKQYTRRFRGASYAGTEWAMGEICRILLAQPDLVRAWGWGIDDKQALHRHVLYVDLYVGQVSFHTGARGQGPDYSGACVIEARQCAGGGKACSPSS